MTQKQHIFEKNLKKDQDIFKKNYIRNWRKILGEKRKREDHFSPMTWKQLSLQKGEGKNKKEINNQHGIKQAHIHQTSKERKMGGQKQWKKVVPWSKQKKFQ